MALDDIVRDVDLKDALGERYLAYALSTIMHRALPDVRDGLKPVHRRLLWGMQRLNLEPRSAPKKCARIVGDVMGQFHPHGDQSIYDALVRMAQDFSLRYPLIDGQGNFGNIDGDNPAAFRYTESRLTEVAMLLMDGLDDDGTDFRPTYDGLEREPVVMPGVFPNLLANGSAGIAVGMATNIPPHNVDEIAQAMIHLLETPEARDATLLKYIKGPDFPTGGVIAESAETIAETYRTGKGGFRLRAKWAKEESARGMWNLVVTEIPYQVMKGKMLEKIGELMAEKKLTLVADVRDESAEDIRIVIEPKTRNADPNLVMEQMFRLTDLETRFSMNLTVVDGAQTPRQMSVKEALVSFIDHSRDVLLRRTRHRLQKIADRLELLEGYLAVYLNIDEVIRIIREEDDPKAEMIARFKLTDNQAEAILNMRLRSLRKLEEIEIRKEHKSLTAERKDLNALLKSPEMQNEKLKGSYQELRTKFGQKTKLGKRRTLIGDAPAIEDVPEDAFIEKEPITIICSEKGWIRAMKGHVDAGEEIKFKEGDRGRFQFHAQTTDKLILFATNGRFYTLAANELPGGRGHGEPVRIMIDLDNEHEIVALFTHQPGRKLVLASTGGHGFIVPEDEVLAQKKAGKQVMNVAEGEEARVCAPVSGDSLAVIGDNRKLLLFPLDQAPEMAKGKGVTLMKFKDGGLLDVAAFAKAEGLVDYNGRTWGVADLKEFWGERAQSGRVAPKGWPKNGKFQVKV
jgi:topoisomerase-4 subunit A